MSRSRITLLAAIFCVIGLWGWRFLRDAPVPHSESPSLVTSARTETGVPNSQGASKPVTVPTPTPQEATTAPLVLPKLKTVRKEVEADPHGTPPSIIAFAEKLAPRMTAALASPQAAVEFFPQLEDCVHAPGTMPSVQALCAGNAQRLAQKYAPQLQGRYQRLFDEAPQQVQSLLKAVETLQQ